MPKKPLLLCLLFFLMLLAFPSGGSAHVYLEEEKLEFEEPPFVYKGTFYTEGKKTCSALRLQFSYHPKNKSVSCSSQEHVKTWGPSQAIVKNGRTFVPLKEIIALTPAKLVWLQGTKEALIIYDTRQISSLMDAYFKRLTQNKLFQGAVWIEKNDLFLKKGYGFRDVQNQIPNTTQTSFSIASITKNMTAVAILQLEEKGKLTVSDRLSQYFPNLPYGDKITIHHLLTHTAGLPWEKVTNYRDIKLIYEPGTNQRYSNVGYMLLGDIIQKVTHNTYENYIRQHIFLPLGMEHSGFDINHAHVSNKAFGYALKNNQMVKVTRDFATRGGSGSLYSSVEDLATYFKAFETEALLSHGAIQDMQTAKYQSWGYGWVVSNQGSQLSLSGSTTGYNSVIRQNMNEASLIILLSNLENKQLDVIADDIERMLRLYE